MLPSGYTPRPIRDGLGVALVVTSFLLTALACPAAVAQTDPLESLKTFSELGPIDLGKLHEGEIRGVPGSPMVFPNGFWTETCFAVQLAPEEVARRLLFWNPSLHPTLKAIVFQKVSDPCTASDFDRLSFIPGNRPLRWLLDKSMATTAQKSELHLSRAESQQLADCVKGKPPPEAVAACWTKLLLERATAFRRDGFAGVAPYDLRDGTVSPFDCLRAMVRERPAVALEFKSLLRQSGLLGDPQTETVALKAFHYWGVYEANYHGTLTLGVVYLLPEGDRYQLLDVQYYVSGTYYTSATLYEVWPSQAGEKTGAVVWRGDFFAAPNLAYTKGIERLAYGAVVLQELKKNIRCFQDDISRPVASEAINTAR
jgi:hypothetical protein